MSAALADDALAFAAGSVLGPAVVTGGFRIDHLRPAAEGLVRATARPPPCRRAGA